VLHNPVISIHEIDIWTKKKSYRGWMEQWRKPTKTINKLFVNK
jgi:hypothetical protein